MERTTRRMPAGTRRSALLNPTVATAKVTPVKKAEPSKSTITYSVNVSEDDEYDARHRVTARKGNSEFEFVLQQDGTPYCCGMREIGSFFIEHNSTTITEAEKVEAVKRLLIELTNSQTEGRNCLTSFFTLISNPACNLVAKAVEAGAPFTLVKSFNNRNGGRNNDLYVSNN